jgi:polyisoprenoid-binding protein YceI
MRTRRLLWTVVALGCALPGVVLAALQASGAKVAFQCTGPGGMHFTGTGSELSVLDKETSLVVSVPLGNMTTGIGLRDTHMREKYLETDKYPTAELSVPKGALQFPADGSRTEGDAAGTLLLHGTSKPVSFHYQATRRGGATDVSAEAHINMNDFDIHPPNYLGVTVKPPVDITVTFRLSQT